MSGESIRSKTQGEDHSGESVTSSHRHEPDPLRMAHPLTSQLRFFSFHQTLLPPGGLWGFWSLKCTLLSLLLRLISTPRQAECTNPEMLTDHIWPKGALRPLFSHFADLASGSGWLFSFALAAEQKSQGQYLKWNGEWQSWSCRSKSKTANYKIKQILLRWYRKLVSKSIVCSLSPTFDFRLTPIQAWMWRRQTHADRTNINWSNPKTAWLRLCYLESPTSIMYHQFWVMSVREHNRNTTE